MRGTTAPASGRWRDVDRAFPRGRLRWPVEGSSLCERLTLLDDVVEGWVNRLGRLGSTSSLDIRRVRETRRRTTRPFRRVSPTLRTSGADVTVQLQSPGSMIRNVQPLPAILTVSRRRPSASIGESPAGRAALAQSPDLLDLGAWIGRGRERLADDLAGRLADRGSFASPASFIRAGAAACTVAGPSFSQRRQRPALGRDVAALEVPQRRRLAARSDRTGRAGRSRSAEPAGRASCGRGRSGTPAPTRARSSPARRGRA